MDYKALHDEHLGLSALALRRLLEADPSELDKLDDFQLELVKRIHGTSFLDKIARRLGQLRREQRELEREVRIDAGDGVERLTFRKATYHKIPADQPDEHQVVGVLRAILPEDEDDAA